MRRLEAPFVGPKRLEALARGRTVSVGETLLEEPAPKVGERARLRIASGAVVLVEVVAYVLDRGVVLVRAAR